MSGVTFFGVSLLEGQEVGDGVELVVTDRVEALKLCKKFKGARFKCFSERGEAVQFTLTKQSILEVEVVVKEAPSEKLPYPTPSPQDMLQFRKVIESGNCEEFLQMVWKNPRFLISAGDTPTMIRERYRYHSLLIGAFKKEFSICKAILNTITDPNFISLLYISDSEEVRKNRMFFLLDTYLNTPDKLLNETPLHFASKFGCAEIVELLLSYPECDRERKNSKGETPLDIVCSACKNASPVLEEAIRSLLSQRYFVPVLRPIDFSSPAAVGKPWSPDVTPSSAECSTVTSPLALHKFPADSQMTLQAMAGPMSPKEADLFYLRMKSPTPVRGSPFQQSRLGEKKTTPLKMMYDSRLSDIDKGVERIGRSVARDLKVPWCEYWSFLGEFCDLTADDGLEKLEKYFREQRDNQDCDSKSPRHAEARSPLSELCTQFNHLHLGSPVLSNPSDDQFFTPPSTPPSHFYDIPPFYVSGSNPSKVDVDVLRALEKTDIDERRFPNVAMWKANMEQHNLDQLSRLRTPATPLHQTMKSPLPNTLPSSPRVSSIASRLNSPRRARDLPSVRLLNRFDEEA